MAQQYGIVCHDKAPYEVLSTPWLPYKDLLLLKGVEEMVELYYNSHQYEKTLEEILKNYGSPFAFLRNWRNFMIEKVTARSAIHGWRGMRSCESSFRKRLGRSGLRSVYDL